MNLTRGGGNSSTSEVTLTLTVHEKQDMSMMTTTRGVESRGSDEGYASASPLSAKSTVVPMTIPEKQQQIQRTDSPSSMEAGWLSRFKRSQTNVEEDRRRGKEQEAEEYIASFSGRSLSIQKELLQKTLNKEKRRIKFGLVSGKLMELAIRRYSYKLSEIERDIELEVNFPKCPEDFGFVLRHYAEKLHLSSESKKFRKIYWDIHGRLLDLTRVMFDDHVDMGRKRQLVLQRIPRKKLHPENSHLWWDEDDQGNKMPSKDHVEWICWGFTPDVEELGRICQRIARQQPPDAETVRLYRAQALL